MWTADEGARGYSLFRCLSYVLNFDVLGPRISLITILYLLLAFASFLQQPNQIRFFLNKQMIELSVKQKTISTRQTHFLKTQTSLSSSSMVNSFFLTCFN